MFNIIGLDGCSDRRCTSPTLVNNNKTFSCIFSTTNNLFYSEREREREKERISQIIFVLYLLFSFIVIMYVQGVPETFDKNLMVGRRRRDDLEKIYM